MRKMVIAFGLLVATACSPAPPAAEAPEAAPIEAAVTPSADPGPYTNSWNSADFSRFNHVLGAPSGGAHTLTLTATTDSPGGETVAVYLAGLAGQPLTGWRMFVIASTRGETATQVLQFPDDGVQPVVVVVENASGRAFSGTYALTIAD